MSDEKERLIAGFNDKKCKEKRLPIRTAEKRRRAANLARRERKLYRANFNYRKEMSFFQVEKNDMRAEDRRQRKHRQTDG